MSFVEVPTDCKADWAFTRVIDYQLVGYDLKSFVVKSSRECLNACLNEQSFQCLSAELHYDTMTCVLSNVSQSVLQVKLDKAPTGQHIDYFESNCANGEYLEQMTFEVKTFMIVELGQ